MKDLKRGTEHIVCPQCKNKATRVGAQDDCDVYVCALKHITRVRVGADRKEWRE